MYVSLFLLPPAAPTGDNRLLGCQAAESSEMEGMTTCVPLGDRPGTEGEIGEQNGGTEKKRRRQESAGVRGVIVCGLTPQGNTVCEWRQKGKVLNHRPSPQFPLPQSDVFSACPGGYGAHRSNIVHFNAISTTIPWWEKGQWNFIVWGEKTFFVQCCHRPFSIGPWGSVKYSETERRGQCTVENLREKAEVRI